MFALLIRCCSRLAGFVIGIGNWYMHGKAPPDEGRRWCTCRRRIAGRSRAAVRSTRVIETQARLYAGSSNPQVGGVPDASVHTVFNGTGWYDDDSNPFPPERKTR